MPVQRIARNGLSNKSLLSEVSRLPNHWKTLTGTSAGNRPRRNPAFADRRTSALNCDGWLGICMRSRLNIRSMNPIERRSPSSIAEPANRH